jgi:hypothetical protein
MSPDGKWLSYLSDETGTFHVYVRPFPNVGDGKWQISAQGASEPLWSRSGRKIFYRAGSDLVAAEVTMTPSFSVGRREVLFDTRDYPFGFLFQSFAELPDERGFILLSTQASLSSDQIVVIDNLSAVLERAAGN